MELIHLPEPSLLFNHGQATEDPRDGLTLFGPLDKGRPYGIRGGVIGTRDGIRRFKNWLVSIQCPVSNNPPQTARPPFPGFEAAFGIPWCSDPVQEIVIDDAELRTKYLIDDRHQRIFHTVDLYASRIDSSTDEDSAVDLWFVVVPDDVHKYCRPQSVVEASVRINAPDRMSVREAKGLLNAPTLFDDWNVAAEPYHFDVNFHNQLKARLLGKRMITQVIRESTIAHRDFLDPYGNPLRDLDALQSAIAWHLSTVVFYVTLHPFAGIA